MKLVHLVNPVKVAKNHELFTAQPITFASMLNAKDYFINSETELVQATTQFEEDLEIIPSEFTKLSNLTRSIGEVNTKLNSKKLPLLNDILQKSSEIENADYVIFTNVDIGLMPHFYSTILYWINKGHDSIIINKRRLSGSYNSISQLPEIFSDLGKSHPGFDCFVFKAELVPQFILDEICVGIPFSGVSLLHNVAAFAKNTKYLLEEHLTFHIGMNVLKFNKDLYYQHNKKVFFKKIEPALKPKLELKNLPYSDKSRFKRAISWALNPSIFTKNYIFKQIKLL